LLERVPFTFFSLKGAKAFRGDGTRPSIRNLTHRPQDVTSLVAKVEFHWGVVLTQTCDVQADEQTGAARKPILLARVRAIEQVVRDFRHPPHKEYIRKVEALANPGRQPAVFYFPSCSTADLPRSGALLLDVQRFMPEDLPALIPLVRLRLSAEALRAFQERCAYCFHRFAAPDGLYLETE
jgi:hypothetical protein